MCALATGALLRTPLAALAQKARANPNLDFPVPYEAATSPVFYFTRATFDPYLNGVFTAAGADGDTVQMKLVGIRDYAPAAGTRLSTRPCRRTNCFALQFRAAAPLSGLTTTHTIEHGALGKFGLFMTESSVRGAFLYEAVINHPAIS